MNGTLSIDPEYKKGSPFYFGITSITEHIHQPDADAFPHSHLYPVDVTSFKMTNKNRKTDRKKTQKKLKNTF